MTELTRLTRANIDTRTSIPPIKLRVRNPQLYVHPRRSRDEQCGCGYPRTPCVSGKQIDIMFDMGGNEIEDTLAYRGNYCHVEQIDHQH